MTLIDIVQDVLNDLDSDSVNSIYDTQESEQIANIAKSTYYEMISRRDYPHLYRLVDLDSSVDQDRPTHMKIATPIQTMGVINYNVQETHDEKIKYREIYYKSPEEFLNDTNHRDSLQDNVEVIKDWSGIDILVKNDKQPQYYTTFDDEWLIFDSYMNTMDSTLQTSKVQAFATVEPKWTMTNLFVPDFPNNHFSAYLAEVKSVCFINLKQVTSQKDEQRSLRGQAWLARKGRKKRTGINYPDMGRKGKLATTRNKNPLFGKDR